MSDRKARWSATMPRPVRAEREKRACPVQWAVITALLALLIVGTILLVRKPPQVAPIRTQSVRTRILAHSPRAPLPKRTSNNSTNSSAIASQPAVQERSGPDIRGGFAKDSELVRIRSEAELKQHKFFRLRDSASGRWLSRVTDGAASKSTTRERLFQFRYHSGHYEAWSIQGHTRMHLTSETSDRVTVDRLWARGYEMWFVVFGTPGAVMRDGSLLSQGNNKKTNSSGDYLFLMSRRNRKFLEARGDSLWAASDGAKAVAWEVFAEPSSHCAPNAPLGASVVAAAQREADAIAGIIGGKPKAFSEKKRSAKQDAIARATLCWGPIPRFEASFQAGAWAAKSANETIIPLFGSPKPPKQMQPANASNAYDPVLIARRTMANWAMLGGGIRVLQLVDQDASERLVGSVNQHLAAQGTVHTPIATERSFEVHATYHQPTYRGLFRAALKKYPEAAAVMYSNMDILFTPLLSSTIRSVAAFAEAERRRRAGLVKNAASDIKGWMIVGQRINYEVPAAWTPTNRTAWADDIEHTFAQRGEVFESDAEDYFVVSRGLFDWDAIPDFVVGGVAFDNWITSKGNQMSAEGRAIVVDATKTVVALHQNHGRDMKGSHRHAKSEYNARLAAEHGGWSLGHTSDALFASEFSPNGVVTIYDKHRLLFD